MALSGSYSGSYRGWTVRSTWSATQSISGNYSDITVNHYLDMASAYNLAIGSRANSCTVDGTSKSFTSSAINKTGGTTYLGQTTYRVYHNSDGTKSCSASTVFNVQATLSGTYVGSISASGTISLDKIPRYATSNQSLSGKTETSITMNWSSDSTCDYIWYSKDNGSTWTGINVTDGKSGSYTISGLTANTTYKIKTRVRRKDSQLTTDSSALSVATYAYPYASSMPNFTIGETLTIGVYNPLGRQFKITVIGADNSEIMAGSTYTGTSVSGFKADSYVNFWYNSIPNSKSGTYKVRIDCLDTDTAQTKTGGTYTVNATDCAPTIGTATYADVNATSVGITGNDQNIVQKQSTVRYTAGTLAAQKGATLSTCSVSVNGNIYNLTLSGTTATGGNAAIDSSSDVTATFTLTDSRGISATKQIAVNMLEWSLPTAIITLQRHNNFYSETDINVDADYSYIDGKNTIDIKVRYKKISYETYSAYISAFDNVTQVLTLDNNYAWDVRVLVTDAFGGATTYNLQISRGMPIIYYDRIKSSTGFNCFPVGEKTVEINGVDILALATRNIITRSLSAAITNLSVNTYTLVPLDLSNSNGSKLTVNDQGEIVVGAGVTKVKVSGALAFETVTVGGNRHARICKNSYSANNTLGWVWDTFEVSEADTLVIPPVLVNVQEGDTIGIYYYSPNSGDKIGGNAYGARTNLTVEVVA